ncbi:putative DNA-binding domain-containing protein [Pseudoxanthomonas daejeonensis]|uniref:HvfC family RiPP maturation protein n=1 Tax=Pseudoxanthomonas daejeonensis TaxID=266062 RepID=UPI001EE49959|nr:putative DNA-binding domain-containing protein [Pseudoxanthomonas daejeonensis]UNK56769.1 putative DNA-binding domain-containing protein [Pseudoxanthomonas daejeonensis]
MPDLHRQQAAFAAHLRDPQAHPAPPGIDPRRMAIYRELFFNNIAGLLGGNFPVIRRTLGEEAWTALVRRFYADHRSHTPLFPELAREFIRFLESRAGQGDPPWLVELAHYEWIELAVQIDDSAVPAHDPTGDLLDGKPVVSPFVRALAYRWPVHTIGPEHRPAVAPADSTLLLVRRDHEGRVRFAAISPLVYRLLELLADGAGSGRASLQALAAEAGVSADEAFMAQGEEMLERMRGEGTLLGSAVP